MADVDIILATSADQDRVFEYLCDNFYADHPLMRAACHKMDKEDCPSSIILKANMSLLAVRTDDPKTICGLSLNQKLGQFKDEFELLFANRAKRHEGAPFAKASQLQYVNSIALNKQVEAQCWKGIDRKDTAKLCFLSSGKAFRGKNIASRLVLESFAISRKHNCRWLVSEAVSFFAFQLFLKLGFKTLSELKYKDYFKNAKGGTTLEIEQPHTAVVYVAKDLNEP